MARFSGREFTQSRREKKEEMNMTENEIATIVVDAAYRKT